MPANRHARVVAEVQALLDHGVPLAFALSTVQVAENAATRGEDLDYGPFLDVTAVWERDHRHTWVIDGIYTDTPDTRERCTGCQATRDQSPAEQCEDEPVSESVEARAWWAAVCRKDFSATIRMHTYPNGDEVWTIRWAGKASLIVANAGESLSDVMIAAMRTDREHAGRAD
jgi:hypothetical protein